MAAIDLAEGWGIRYRWRPIAFADRVIPWGQGIFESWEEPLEWQRQFLTGVARELHDKGWGPAENGRIKRKVPVRRVISSCTGSGKSKFVLPLSIFWMMAAWSKMRVLVLTPTREHAKDHLFKDCKAMWQASPVLKEIFHIAESGMIFRKDAPETCVCLFRTAEQAKNLTGTHSHGALTYQVVDDGHAVEDAVWDAASGMRDDPQALVVVAGNPLETFGFFYELHSGKYASLFHPTFLSKRDCMLPGEEWTPTLEHDLLMTYGGDVDSPVYRPNVLGLPPLLGSEAFITQKVVEQAMHRPLVDANNRRLVHESTPVVCGLDLAKAGENNNCVSFRAGIDARTIPHEAIAGRDIHPADRLNWCFTMALKARPPYGPPVCVWFDSSGADPTFMYDLRNSRPDVRFFPFDSSSEKEFSGQCATRRASLWVGFNDFLVRGGCIPDDPVLKRAIAAARPLYGKKGVGKLNITPKAEMEDAIGKRDRNVLDRLDALMLSCLAPPFRTSVPSAGGRSAPGAEPPAPVRTSWMQRC